MGIQSCWVKLLGVWIMGDGIFSLVLWIPFHESWWRDHSFRVVRIIAGIVMIIWG